MFHSVQTMHKNYIIKLYNIRKISTKMYVWNENYIFFFGKMSVKKCSYTFILFLITKMEDILYILTSCEIYLLFFWQKDKKINQLSDELLFYFWQTLIFPSFTRTHIYVYVYRWTYLMICIEIVQDVILMQTALYYHHPEE